MTPTDRQIAETRLQALLNKRAYLDSGAERGFTDKQLWRERFELGLGAIRLAYSLLTDAELEAMYLDEGDAITPDMLISRFTLLQPLMGSKDSPFDCDKIIEELVSFYYGDEPVIFRSLPRRPGQPRRPYKVARMRLHALSWREHLRRSGWPNFDAESSVSQAYKTSWDAIRKWRGPCTEILGELLVRLGLEGNLRTSPSATGDSARAALQADGAAYYAEISKQSGEDSR